MLIFIKKVLNLWFYHFLSLMNLIKKYSVLLVIAIATCFYIYARVTLNREVLVIAKPVTIFSIIIYYIVKASKVNYLHLLILSIYFVCDMLFLFQKTNGLFMGLTFYFVASSMLSVDIIGRIRTFEVKDFIKILLPTAILMLSLFYFIFKDIGIVKVAVLLFSISLILLISSALFYYFKASKKQANWILFGAFLFFACNLIAAINKFIHATPLYGTLSSLFYVCSLLCFVNYMTEDVEQIA